MPDDAILPPAEEVSEQLPSTDFTPAPVDEVPPAEFIRIDLVPANAQFSPLEGQTTPEARFLPNVRIIITNDHATVYAEGSPEPQRVLVGALTGFTGSNKEGYTAHLPDGTLYFRRSESCACGSRLRGIRPYPYVPHAPISIF